MKNSILKTLALIAFVAVAALPAKLNAQITGCSYDIYNMANCDITIIYQIYSSSGPCGVVGPIVLLAGQVESISCAALNACGGAPWDIDVSIVRYDGIPVTSPQTVNSTFAGPVSWGPCATGVSANCCAGATFQITWTGTSTTIQ